MTGNVRAISWMNALAEASLDAEFIIEPIGSPVVDFRWLYANQIGAAMFRTTPDALIGQLTSVITPPYGSGFREDALAALRENKVIRRVTTDIAPEIASSLAEYRIVPFEGLLAISATDRSPEYEALQQSAVLRKILSSEITASLTPSALVIPIFDGGRVVDLFFEQANEHTAALFGKKRSEVEGRNLYDFSPRTKQGIVELVTQSIRSRRALLVDYDARHSPFAADWLRLQVTPVGDFVLLHAEDVSEQHRDEETLRLVIDQAAELIVVSNRDGLLRYVNPFALDFLGLTEDAIKGKSIRDLCEPGDQAGVIEDYLDLLHGRLTTARRRVRMLTSAGEVRTVIGTTSVLPAPNGDVDGFVSVVVDLTEQIASEEARNELAADLSMAEQRERNRLGEQLHDGPVQQLSALSMQLGAALERFETAGQTSSPEEVVPFLQQAETIVIDTINDLRSLMFRLSPADLEDIGLGRALHVRAQRIFEGTNVNILFESAVIPALSPGAAATLFRLGQEAIVNARKHARASTVRVTLNLNTEKELLSLGVVDDGVGAEAKKYERDVPGHLGLNLIRDRARQLGGTVEILGSPGHGTAVRIQVPLAAVRLPSKIQT
jgi:PAS domain S-box-containing protein